VSEPSPPRGPTRRALITGASAGIGRTFAERLAREQMDLCLVARRQERLDTLAAELREARGIEVEVRTADLTDTEDLLGVCAAVAERPPDLLVNNAGFGTIGRFVELDAEEEDREIRLNVLALTRLTHAALPGMVERGHGSIINVSSMAGLVPGPFTATYAATKAFVTSLSEALYEELRDSGVRVQALLPGFTRTEFQERAGVDAAGIPDFAWMSAAEVVEASLDALERGEAVCIPGLANRALSNAQRLVPRGLARRLYGMTIRRTLDT